MSNNIVDYSKALVFIIPEKSKPAWAPLSSFSPDLPDDVLIRVCKTEAIPSVYDICEKSELEAKEGSLREDRMSAAGDIIEFVNEIVGGVVVKPSNYTIIDSIETYVKLFKKNVAKGFKYYVAANETGIMGD